MATRIFDKNSWKVGDIRELDFDIRREKQEFCIIAKGNRLNKVTAKW